MSASFISEGYSDDYDREPVRADSKPVKGKCSVCGIWADRDDLMEIDKKLFCPEDVSEILETKKP